MIIAKTIPEARALALDQILMCGDVQFIQRGSFANEAFRIQLPYLTIQITNHTFDRVPVPPTKDWPKEMTLKHGAAYYDRYILGSSPPSKNETYTYASRISEEDQLVNVMNMLLDTPLTNQAVVTVGRPEDVLLDDPACLRTLQFMYTGDKLNLHSYWRSHDVFAGLPENFFGLSCLLEDVAAYAQLPCGSLYYYSAGAHIYSYQLAFLD